MSLSRRLLWTAFALAVVAAAASGRVDALGRSYAQDALTRALLTFAVARTLNGVISTAQGTELSLEPGGVGVNFSIGEVLDPINDLVERFSGVMLVATSSIGLQNVLLRITAWWGVNAVLYAAAALLAAGLWVPRLSALLGAGAQRWLLIVCLLRFAVPALMITSSLVFDTFLAQTHAEATRALEATGEEIESINEEAAPPADGDTSIVDRLGTALGESLRNLDARARIDRLRSRVADAAQHVVDLIVIFVFQTILLPLAFLWAVVELLKGAVASTARR